MPTANPQVPPPVAERTKHPFLTYDMIQEIPDSLQKTSEILAKEAESIAQRVRENSHFYFTGCGTAFFSAMLGSSILSLLPSGGLEFECVQALELSNQNRVSGNSLGFGVSHSGITKTTLDALRSIKSRDGYTVGITHFAGRPISVVADKTLIVGNGPDKSRCHTKCYVAGAFPLTLMSLGILEQQRALGKDRTNRIRAELLGLPQVTKKILASTEAAMKELAEGSAEKRTIYFAGTGGNYANALEAALKIMETSYLPAQGFETEQLMHGPWASIDSEAVVFVMATESGTRARSMDLVKAATNLGSTVIPIVYEGDRETAAISGNTIELPKVDEQVAPYLSIIPLYLFAYYMAVQRGNNPDYLRYLTPAYWDARTIIFPPGTH